MAAEPWSSQDSSTQVPAIRKLYLMDFHEYWNVFCVCRSNDKTSPSLVWHIHCDLISLVLKMRFVPRFSPSLDSRAEWRATGSACNGTSHVSAHCDNLAIHVLALFYVFCHTWIAVQDQCCWIIDADVSTSNTPHSSCQQMTLSLWTSHVHSQLTMFILNNRITWITHSVAQWITFTRNWQRSTELSDEQIISGNELVQFVHPKDWFFWTNRLQTTTLAWYISRADQPSLHCFSPLVLGVSGWLLHTILW